MNGPKSIELRDAYPHFIDGEAVQPARNAWIGTDDPSTGEHLTRGARGSEEDVDRAVRSAQRGFETWRKLEPPQRSRIMLRIAEGVRAHSESLTLLETRDTGKPLKVARAEIETCARYFEYFAGVADKMLGEVIPASNKHLMYTAREPYGVTGHIIPWNGPLTQAGRGAAPALCAGNSVVLKPAEQTPITTFEFARICIEAGLPPGVLNVVNGYGAEAGAALVAHPLVRKVSFTGSVATGRSVLRTTAERIVPATVELGGKSPFIVFEDADIERAAQTACRAFVLNSGQICSAGTRLFVARQVQSRFVECLREEMKSLRVGRGIDDLNLGPVVSRTQLERVMGYIEIGRGEGATVAHGGGRPKGLPDGGHYVEPTLLCDGTNDMRVAREEIFGPVGLVIPFDRDEDAIAMANDSDFGLASALWTSDVGRAHAYAEQLQAGQVYINDYQPIGPEAPFGGYKNSGFGREKGLASLHDYTQVKTVIVNKTPRPRG